VPKTPNLDNLPPHLKAAMHLKGSAGGNACVQRSAALMLDLTGATLVFGVLRAATPEERARIGDNASPVPFIHAWVEYRGELLAPTLIETFGELRPLPVELYYGENGVKRTWRLEHKAFMQVARRYRLASAFRHGSAHGQRRDYRRHPARRWRQVRLERPPHAAASPVPEISKESP
jgi:hypothetical protein